MLTDMSRLYSAASVQCSKRLYRCCVALGSPVWPVDWLNNAVFSDSAAGFSIRVYVDWAQDWASICSRPAYAVHVLSACMQRMYSVCRYRVASGKSANEHPKQKRGQSVLLRAKGESPGETLRIQGNPPPPARWTFFLKHYLPTMQ